MHLAVLSPDKQIFEGEVNSVTVPGIEGEFQVLDNHAPIVAALGKGNVEIEKQGGSRDTFAIDSGFIEVLNNNVSLLVKGVQQ